VGRPKVESARDTLRRLNPDVVVVTHAERLTSANALELVARYDVVVDGTDNFPARYLATDACVLRRKPYVYGAIFRWEGQASLFAPHLGGPCYRCLFPEPPPAGTVPSCAEAGVFGVLPGVIGCLQATEAVKLLLGLGEPLLGRLLLFDALGLRFREVKVKRDPACPLCGGHPTITGLTEHEPACQTPRAAPAKARSDVAEVTVQDMKRALDDPSLGITVLDVREPAEWAIARVAGVRPLALSELPRRIGELDPQRTYYLHCKSGVRSRQAAELLGRHGFAAVKSVRGGILAWAAEVDPKVPAY
jgi:adenylyltransferase/sulfurtransferase